MVFMLVLFKIRPVSLSSAFAYCLYLISFDPELPHNKCPYQILNTDVFRKARLSHPNKQIPNKSYREQGEYVLSCVTIIFG